MGSAAEMDLDKIGDYCGMVVDGQSSGSDSETDDVTDEDESKLIEDNGASEPAGDAKKRARRRGEQMPR